MKLIDAEEVHKLGTKLAWLGRFETSVANGNSKIYVVHCYERFGDVTYDFTISREAVEEHIRCERAAIKKRLAELEVEL
jgi:hypothetical protein